MEARGAAGSDDESSESEDLRLVRAAGEGDAAAFEALVRRHAGMVMGLGRRLLRNREEAEDLMQDVFLRMHRGLGGFRGEASVKGWLARITVNAARNRQRTARRRFFHVTSSLDQPVGEDGPTPAETLVDERAGPDRESLSTEIRERLSAALAGMSEDFREVIVLRDIEGLSYDEIAEATGVPKGTVKSRIARARSRLQDALGDLVDAKTGTSP